MSSVVKKYTIEFTGHRKFLMFGLGFTEILVILAVALLVFGPDRLPELSRTIGRTIGTFRKSMDELRADFDWRSVERWEPPAEPQPDQPRRLAATEPNVHCESVEATSGSLSSVHPVSARPPQPEPEKKEEDEKTAA